MHTVWKGAISFGLVHVPVKLYTATENQDISMKLLHRKTNAPIRYTRTCDGCDGEVPWEDIIKGYEYEPGKFVTFEKEELQALGEESSKEIKIVDFVDLREIDPIYFQKTYYMSPGDTGANAYNLLKRALLETGKIGIANVTLRSKGSLAAIRVVDGCLSMVTMYYPAEIRPVSQVPNLPADDKVDERELAMAKMLIEQLSVPFEPAKFEDEYRKRLMEAIEAKIGGKQVVAAPEMPKESVVNLMEALQASLELARATAQREMANETAGKKAARGKKTDKTNESGGAAGNTAGADGANKTVKSAEAANPATESATAAERSGRADGAEKPGASNRKGGGRRRKTAGVADGTETAPIGSGEPVS
jgi:DNA end-binding protein Ku